mmetsp:Transcript_11524/g.53557  ORF Transcript_11524/g.53557 Transcript_11524/m.53557 type:complete len:222 (-) Transcript_11524:3621-4286(-)
MDANVSRASREGQRCRNACRHCGLARIHARNHRHEAGDRSKIPATTRRHCAKPRSSRMLPCARRYTWVRNSVAMRTESTACSSSSSGVRVRRPPPAPSSIESTSDFWFTAARGPPRSPRRCDFRAGPPAPPGVESISRCMNAKYSLLNRLPLNTNCRFWVMTCPRICRGMSGTGVICVRTGTVTKSFKSPVEAADRPSKPGVAALDGGIEFIDCSSVVTRS